ncbi:MAG: hypothetical protein WAM71_20630 [Candidatus Korobacteraceae bacterium]
MYEKLLAPRDGQHIYQQVLAAQMVTRMIELSDHGFPALGALTDTALPANLSNRFKRLAGFLVKRVMSVRGYAQIPGRRSRISDPSLFKRGACYRAIGDFSREPKAKS